VVATTAGPDFYVVAGLVLLCFGILQGTNFRGFGARRIRIGIPNASDKTVRRYAVRGWAVAALGLALLVVGLARL
jgi:hypothetical protein